MEWPEFGGGQTSEDVGVVLGTKAMGRPKPQPAYKGLDECGQSEQRLLPELPDTSGWPEHARDATKFLLYRDKGENVMDTRELTDWGIEWRNCMDAFLKMFKAAGFPHLVGTVGVVKELVTYTFLGTGNRGTLPSNDRHPTQGNKHLNENPPYMGRRRHWQH